MPTELDPLVVIPVTIGLIGLIVLAQITAHERTWRDPQRFFDYADKRFLRAQAHDRCEHKPPLWRRCPAPAEEADHVIPWSQGGQTHTSNGQYLCHRHNQRKGAHRPSALYIYRLHRRRRHYAPRSRP